jgi:hypothetical protein
MRGLIAGMSELVALTHALPGYDGLGLLPAEIANRSGSVRDATIDIDTRFFSLYTLNLSALDAQHGTSLLLLLSRATHECQQRQ